MGAQRVTKEVMEQLIRATKKSGSKIKREFRKMDKDKNGELSAKEFAAGLRNLLGVDLDTSWDYVTAMMPILDVNGDNSINYDEFRNAFRTTAITRKLADKMMRAVESGKANIRQVFDAMDTNGDGVLNRAEFKAGLEELGLIKEVSAGELDELMAFVDVDGDDHVDLEEFIALCP